MMQATWAWPLHGPPSYDAGHVGMASGPEIRRRIKKASETFRRLWRVWAMKGLPLKLKGRLYSAFVHSVLLYNSEVWTITETDMKALVGRNGYMMRRLVGEVVRGADDKRLTESQLFGDAWFGVDSVVDSQEKAAMGGSLCEKGRRGSLVEEDSARG